DRAKQAQELALGHTFPAPRAPAGRAGRPRSRSLHTFGQPLFTNRESEHARSRPYGQDERGSRLGFFTWTEQLLHAGLIMPYAVAEASPRDGVSVGILGEACQKRPAFSLLCSPSPH